MSFENFPHVYRHIADLCTSNADILKLFEKLEHALKEKEELHGSKDQIIKNMYVLLVDLSLVRQAADQFEQNRKSSDIRDRSLATSEKNLLQLADFIDDERTDKSINFLVLSKQTEVQEKLNLLEKRKRNDNKCMIEMERRTIVKEYQKCQCIVKETEAQYMSIKNDDEELNRQLKTKINRATDQRDKKIISLVRLRQKIAELSVKLEMPGYGSSKSMQAKEHATIAIIPRAPPLALKSARDFLVNYSEVGIVESEILSDEKDKKMELPLCSILVVNQSQESFSKTHSPTKQVHFAPLPSPIQNHKADSSAMYIEDLNHENEMIIDTSELSLDPKESEQAYIPFVKSNPERVNIESVEVLPPLNLNLLIGSKSVSSASNPGHKSFFFDNESMQDDEYDKQTDSTMLERAFQTSPQQSTVDDSDSNNVNKINTLNFSALNCNPTHDFLINFDNEGKDNAQSYEL